MIKIFLFFTLMLTFCIVISVITDHQSSSTSYSEHSQVTPSLL